MSINTTGVVSLNHHPCRQPAAWVWLGVGLVLIFRGNTRAAVLAYEPFTNAPGTAIIGSADGFGFSSAWQNYSSSQGTATNTAAGLNYTDGLGHTLLASGGAGFFQGLTTANNSMQPIRLFSFSRGTNGTDGVTTWISFLSVRQGPVNSGNNPYARGANVPHDLDSGNVQKLAIGNSTGAATNTIGLIPTGSAGNLKRSEVVFSQTNFIVVRVDHVAGAANDNAYLFVNPTLGVEPLLAEADTNTLGAFDFSFDRVRVFAGGNNGTSQPYAEFIVDEYRLGETYTDVTPYVNGPQPPVSGLLITNVQLATGNLVLSGTGGSSSGTYHLLANANPRMASTNWPAVATNSFDASGNFVLTNPIQADVGEQFFRLRIPPPPAPIAPSILSGPVSLTLTQGHTAAFSVTAEGTAPLSYQWYFNTNSTLSGQTASNLTIVTAQATNAGSYSVRVSNAGGNITSTQATLTILLPPVVVTQPLSQTVLVSNNVNFSVVATGTPPLRYQWYFNSNLLANQTNVSLALVNLTTNDAGSYHVTVSNDYGSTISYPATLTVSEPNTNGDWFVSPTGSDANPGTLAAPFATLNKAASVALPGHTILMRGGTYYPSSTVRITNSGTAGARIQLLAYPGETPYLNFTNQPYGSNNRGILFPTNANYWIVKGLEIGYAGDNGIKVEGSHHRFEQCVFHHNGDTGLQIGFGHDDENPGGLLAAFIEVVNCDSYLNYDSDSNGGDADGFAAKMHCGQGIVFAGCRAWENSDDGWDLFETDYSVVISNCWTWKSGVAQGNGNGFKLGGNGTGGDSVGTHYAWNCVAFGHKVNGFTQNSHKDGVVVINCLAFTNGNSGYNYFMEGSLNSGKQNIFQNNASIPRTIGGAGSFIEDNSPLQQNNSWNLSVTNNAADYVSLLESAAKAPRNPDGSLPTGFARLVSGSDLIDKGVNVGIPFNGSAPDLGPYEYAP